MYGQVGSHVLILLALAVGHSSRVIESQVVFDSSISISCMSNLKGQIRSGQMNLGVNNHEPCFA